MQALSIRNLRKLYRNDFEALKGIDLDVEAGDFFALLGPNGAGKSTVIGIISSLMRKTGGVVRVFGHDLDQDPEAVKAAIGLVPQEFNFNQFEPVEEIVVNQAGFYGIPRREAFQRAESLLRELDLWDRRRAMARELSGGMKRRLMIARALAHQPRLLILDEPTAGVDIEIRRSMWRYLQELNRNGTTIILTTHYLEEAETLCRNIGIIDHGQIIEQGRMGAILHKLHAETLVFNLNRRLDAVPDIDGYRIHRLDDLTIEVESPRDRPLNDLFRLLSAQGIEVVSLRNKENRLERVFMDLVGQRKGEAA